LPKDTITLAASVTDYGGNRLYEEISWRTLNHEVASVDQSGLVTAVAPGRAEIEARSGQLSASATVEVKEALGMGPPLLGVLNEDFFYNNYVDHDPGGGILDYRCGPKTYNGHRGTDLTLPSFATMDSGVTIVAVAPGTVTAARDGYFDRNKNGGTDGNWVAIIHEEGYASIYRHMAINSVAVSAGQTVEKGTVLGRVGSSGNSTMPHLHLEVLHNGMPVDPFSGPCGLPATLWEDADEYQDSFKLMALGTSDVALTLDIAKDPPELVETFRTDASRVTVWVQLINVRAGTTSRFRWYDPDGALFWDHLVSHNRFYSMSWWWAWHKVPGFMTKTGTWRVDYLHDSKMLGRLFFELVPPAAASDTPATGQTVRGTGGGGLEGEAAAPAHKCGSPQF
jgi:murein DD-endopeptidase MepM/ murein hydrolase activator NlpD